MKKELAEILAETGRKMVGKAFVQSPDFVENRVLSVEVELEPGTVDEYHVVVGIESYVQEYTLPIPGSFDFYYFKRNFYPMTFEDKLRILHLNAAKKFEMVKNSTDQWNLLMQGFISGDQNLFNKQKFQLYRDWQEAQNEYHNLYCFAKNQSIDLKSNWS